MLARVSRDRDHPAFAGRFLFRTAVRSSADPRHGSPMTERYESLWAAGNLDQQMIFSQGR
jgi:hypothetical protein